MPPTLKNVIRLDSTPLSQAFFTPEGYLKDSPIVTSTGIFEYSNSDGSVRRELRLPDDVFATDSLASYEGKPIIITHEAGLVNKDNVDKVQIGTILTKGYRSGDDVRAKIVIHNTDEMKQCGLKELSLGYNLDLEETPGEWNGQHYDAIQRNIRINHLALVREARAGERARLNIDSRDDYLKGEKVMHSTINVDGVLSPEELEKAIAEYKARRAGKEGFEKDAEVPAKEEVEEVAEPVQVEEPVAEEAPEEPKEVEVVEKDAEEPVKPVEIPVNKADLSKANSTISEQNEDIQTLLDIIDTLLAEREFKNTQPKNVVAKDENDVEEEMVEETEEEELNNEDGFDDDIPSAKASDVKLSEATNADSVDAIVRQRIKLGMLGKELNMDGLENMDIMTAKKAIINAVRPTVNLDGKSATYVNAMFDYAADDVQKNSRKTTEYQKKQMFNNDGIEVDENSADAARLRMIERRNK